MITIPVWLLIYLLLSVLFTAHFAYRMLTDPPDDASPLQRPLLFHFVLAGIGLSWLLILVLEVIARILFPAHPKHPKDR